MFCAWNCTSPLRRSPKRNPRPIDPSSENTAGPGLVPPPAGAHLPARATVTASVLKRRPEGPPGGRGGRMRKMTRQVRRPPAADSPVELELRSVIDRIAVRCLINVAVRVDRFRRARRHRVGQELLIESRALGPEVAHAAEESELQ